MLPRVNGHIINFPEVSDKEEYIDRRISNMLTFKPEFRGVPSIDDHYKTDNLERILALEVAEIVNKKSKTKNGERIKENIILDDSNLNAETLQKATQTEPYSKSPVNTLRGKSFQFLSKIFMKEELEEDVMEDKKMDDLNSEGDCKASPLDVFRYPNIRRKFFILTFDWVALGVVYNSLSYNTPNLGVDDYLAFFIGKYVTTTNGNIIVFILCLAKITSTA